MRSDSEKDYFLKAVDAFKRRLIVVSPELEILAASPRSDGKSRTEITKTRGRKSAKRKRAILPRTAKSNE